MVNQFGLGMIKFVIKSLTKNFVVDLIKNIG